MAPLANNSSAACGSYFEKLNRQANGSSGLDTFFLFRTGTWIKGARETNNSLVGAAGLEPATLCLEGKCSIRLSYAPTGCYFEFIACSRRNLTPSNAIDSGVGAISRQMLAAALSSPSEKPKLSIVSQPS